MERHKEMERERERIERERERDRQAQQQHERERQEKQSTDQAVTKHFEESLRRAKEKVSFIYLIMIYLTDPN